MSFKETVSRVYRETTALYKGAPVTRAEIIEAASASLMVEVRAGRLAIDQESAVRAALVKADESDGRAADRIIARAATGDIALVDADLDVVVTLGGGLRKPWSEVTATDLDQMNKLRFENYQKVRDSFRAFNGDVLAVREVVKMHGTFGAAFEAGGFPPAAQAESKVA